ncbi:MAG: hypothetical protein HC821_04225 [Lewinella sp.]|nr:hypothetical protein [Lewinella sp.]
MRFLLTALAVLMFHFSVQSQLLEGPAAAAVWPAAASLRYAAGQELPQYLRLQPGQEQPVAEAGRFLSSAFKLPAEHGLELLQTTQDRSGIKHHRYRQTVSGYPVWGGIYLFHGQGEHWYEANGELYLPSITPPRILLDPSLALQTALRLRPAEKYGWDAQQPTVPFPTPFLIWAPKNLEFKDGNFRLAYAVNVYRLQPSSYETLYIDAETGQLVASENHLHTAFGSVSAQDSIDHPALARTRYSGQRPILTNQVDSTGLYILRESGRNIQTYDAQRRTDLPRLQFTDADNFWENVNAARNEVATDCHWGSEQYYDFYSKCLAATASTTLANSSKPMFTTTSTGPTPPGMAAAHASAMVALAAALNCLPLP